jgi:DNA replication and repair protein RecF
MILSRLRLVCLRNFDDRVVEFHPLLTIIIGENAKGKTNILEGVFVAVHGEGFRESKEEELIKWKEEKAFVESVWVADKEVVTNSVSLVKQGDKVTKHYYVNKTKKPHYAYLEFQTKSVLFAPEHIEIVTGAPDLRREYFNRTITVFDPSYKKTLNNYEHALYKRNKILEFHKDEMTLIDELAFWNDYLEKHAFYITGKRDEYCNYLNSNPSVDGKKFRIEYVKNMFTRARSHEVFDKERRVKRTLIGPQKDDFILHLTNADQVEPQEKNIHHFGSRSEQRLGVFWLKLNEIRHLEAVFKTKPILLLDDVFSELDTHNKQLVLNMIGEYQTVLTTTEQELVDLAHLNKITINL